MPNFEQQIFLVKPSNVAQTGWVYTRAGEGSLPDAAGSLAAALAQLRNHLASDGWRILSAASTRVGDPHTGYDALVFIVERPAS